jgi:hypothetical protein
MKPTSAAATCALRVPPFCFWRKYGSNHWPDYPPRTASVDGQHLARTTRECLFAPNSASARHRVLNSPISNTPPKFLLNLTSTAPVCELCTCFGPGAARRGEMPTSSQFGLSKNHIALRPCLAVHTRKSQRRAFLRSSSNRDLVNSVCGNMRHASRGGPESIPQPFACR